MSASPNRERGYILPMTALLLIPLMLFAGFATDVGSWFLRAQKAQIAADAGAAAAVVWVPNVTEAENNALEAVRRNGFPTASLVTSFAAAEASPTPPPLPWVTVTIQADEAVDVDVRTVADTFFTSPVLDSVPLSRSATAQFVKPTPLGNPTSALGTGGDTEYPGTPDNFYLQTRNDNRVRGDIIGPAQGWDATPNPLFTALAGQPELQGAYFFTVEVPASVAGQYELQLRVSCYASTNSGNLNWSVYAPDGTPNDPTDNTAAGAIASGVRTRTDNTCTDSNPDPGIDVSQFGRLDDPATTGVNEHVQFVDTAQWISLQNLDLAGTYVLRTRADSGATLYSIRAVRRGFTGAAQHCTSIPLTNEAGGTDPATPDCPRLSSVDWLGSSALEDTLSNGIDPVEIYLTEVRPELAGNRLEVTLFDPADGIECVRVLDPWDNPVPFTWRTIDNEVWGYNNSLYNFFTNNGSGDLPPTNSVPCGLSGGTALTDPRPPAAQIGGVGQVFQDRTVRFELQINTPACNGNNCWYRVQYEKGGDPTATNLYDWNSWAVRVVGDPVRLIR